MFKKVFQAQSFSVGLAMFSMFFGAGNIIYPLTVGQYAGEGNVYGMLGLILTAAVMPIAGVIAMVLFDGNYNRFFGRLGKAGFLLAFLTISLLGPLGSTPRCIVLAYTTLKNSFAGLAFLPFSFFSCVLVYLCTVKRNHILFLLGKVLTPLLLLSLMGIIAMGLYSAQELPKTEEGPWHLFLHGLKEGYNTMDLLAAFFFSSTIFHLLKNSKDSTHPMKITLQASLVGAFLLAAVYVGFSYLAAFHGGAIFVQTKDQLLGAITLHIAGPYAGLLVCSTIALACLTTAIALIAAFTDFVQKEVFQEKLSYEITLALSLLCTFLVSMFKFTGISAFLGPILEICYPGLIVLTFLNIAYCTSQFKPVKTPVFITFALSTYLYFFGV